MYLLFVLSALCASTYTLGKKLLEFSPPMFLIGVRLAIAGLIFYTIYRIMQKTKIQLTRRDYFVLLQTGLFGYSIPFIFEFWSLQYMISAKTAFLYSLSPVVTGIFSYLIFHEKMTKKKWIGLGIAISAVIPELVLSSSHEGSSIFFLSLPEIVALLGVLSFNYNSVLTRKALKVHEIPLPFLSAVGMAIGGLISFIFSMIVEVIPNWGSAGWIAPSIPITNLGSFVGYLALIILFGNILYMLLMGYLLKRFTATIVSFSELLVPLFAALFGWFFLGETVSWYFFVSLGALMVGMYIYYQEEKRLGYIQ